MRYDYISWSKIVLSLKKNNTSSMMLWLVRPSADLSQLHVTFIQNLYVKNIVSRSYSLSYMYIDCSNNGLSGCKHPRKNIPLTSHILSLSNINFYVC